MVYSFIAAAGLASITGCGNRQKSAAVPAIDLTNLDTTTRPGVDFYEFACGGWIQNNPLRPEYSRFGAFERLREENLSQLRTIVEEVSAQSQTPGSIAQKIATLYALGLDSTKLNADGVTPVKEQLTAIEAIADKDALSKMVATLHREGMAPYFAIGVDADDMNSKMNILLMQQAGLAMGDRDYYLAEDAQMQKVRDAYLVYINKLFTLAGYTAEEAAAAADAVRKIENKIATASYSREALRDSYKNYNKMSVAELQQLSDLLDWKAYFTALGLPDLDTVNVRQRDFYPALSEALSEVTLDEQKLYLEFNLLDAAAPYLSDDFQNASFAFYGKTLSGAQQQKPRWKRALATTDGALSEALGQLYVEKYFPASSKEKMLQLVGNLQKALGQRIDGLTWMSDATKAKAQEKLASFTVKIGYPDQWRDYSGLDIQKDSYWANVCRSNIFDMEYQLSQADKPVDKGRWYMSPQTVNAYYNPTTNEICFPAAILQPPFFNPDADDAVNYGAIGVVIGHEMTHGFDDQGRNYDKDGNLTDWWTAEDAAQFQERAEKLAAQYDAIIVLDTVHANGHFTLGENIADQGGLQVAHAAYKNSLAGGPAPEPIDGFTDEQRFYLGYATLWSENIRDEEILRRTKIDPHSLGRWRVNAALRNLESFFTAFDIQEGDPMYLAPEDRVTIW